MHHFFCDEFSCCVSQALELNQTNTKALFRRAQAWQGLKEYSKAMVTSAQAPLASKSVLIDLIFIIIPMYE